jgi:hypothetical protein
MDVYEAVTSRRAVRGFTNEPVSREVLERVPWNIYVMTGAPLAQLKKLATERVAAGDPWDERDAAPRSAGIAMAHSGSCVRTPRRA